MLCISSDYVLFTICTEVLTLWAGGSIFGNPTGEHLLSCSVAYPRPLSSFQILKPADKKLYYGGGGGMGSGRPVTPPRNSAKGGKAKK